MADNADQIAYWNSEAGRTWAAEADALDAMLAPLGALAMEALGPVSDRAVLDVGCGAGATSRALADLGARVTGVDVSAPLLALARARAGGPTYLQADAGADPLPGPFDALFSRFGVMFFADPPAAFAHLRAAMAPGASLAFVCWASMAENAWAMEPVLAALPHLATPPEPAPPGAPGPFAFAEPGRAAALLTQAGWRDAAARPWRGDYVVGADPVAALDLMLKIGPLGRLLREQPDSAPAVRESLKALIDRRTTDAGVVFQGSVWIVTAQA